MRHPFILTFCVWLFARSAFGQTATPDPEPEPGAQEPNPSGDSEPAQGAQGAQGASNQSTQSAVPVQPPLTPEAQRSLGVADADVGDFTDPDRLVHRTLIPPFFLHERSANRRTTVVFPFVYSDRRAEERTLLVPPYYRFRSPRARTDVVFPLYFHWRGSAEGQAIDTYGTDVIPPVYYHWERGDRQRHLRAFGLAPLFFYGESFEENGSLRREHLVIPPLLAFHTWRPEHALTVAGLFYYDRAEASTHWGLAPLFFAGNNLSRNYLFIPGLLTYHQENHVEGSSTTVCGPFWTTTAPDGASVNLAPVFFHRHTADSSRTTVLPLFHFDRGADSRTVVTPLGLYARRGESRTFATWVYQYHRGETNWDAVAPFFFSSREPSTGAHSEAVFPLFYHRWSPSSNSWWVLPTIHSHSTGNDWFFNIYPLVYTGRSGSTVHTVVAPVFWDFHNTDAHTRATMAAGLFWRFSTPTSLTELVGNVLWVSSERNGVRSYEWHVLPLFSYARPRPEDLSWNVLFGLVGYRRAGTQRQLKLFWIPIGL